MQMPIADATIAQFRSALASRAPTPAGVAVAAASASFALGLLVKVLEVSGRRRDFAGNAATLHSLSAAAQNESQRMLELAQDDIASFDAYLASARMPHATPVESENRRRAINRAAQNAIDTPLNAARAAATGIALCADASPLAHAAVIADLGTAVCLLESALNVFLLCAASNAAQLALGSSPNVELAGRRDWEVCARRDAESVLKHVAAVIDSLPKKAAENS